MAKVVISLTRDDISKKWFIPGKPPLGAISSVFTSEETDTLKETKNVYTSLPGYVSSYLTFVDDYKYTFTIEFDTQQNAESAFNILNNPLPNSPFFIIQDLINKKRQELNLNYIQTITLE